MTLDWPTGFDRTPRRDREPTSRFKASLATTASDLATELERLDPGSWRVETGSGGAHTKANGLPKHSANPDDPGVVLHWTTDGDQFAVACDHYTSLRDNLRTVYLWVHETRMRAQRPVETGASEFAAARLPPGDGGAQRAAVAPSATQPPHEVLDVAPDADAGVVEAAYRAKLKDLHPDHGGDPEQFAATRRAKEAMLDE